MSYSCCSGTFSSRSLRGCLPSSGPSCSSSYPSNLVYRTNSCSPSTCQLGSSLYSGCQETCCEPSSCQASYVVSRVSSPCQRSCYHPRTSTLCRPCQTTDAGSLGFGSSSFYPLGYGSRSCYSLGCGSSGLRSLNYGLCGFPSLSYGSRFYSPISFPCGSFYPSCYQPFYRYGFC